MHITPLYLLIALGWINTHTPDKSISRNQAPPDLKIILWMAVAFCNVCHNARNHYSYQANGRKNPCSKHSYFKCPSICSNRAVGLVCIATAWRDILLF